MHTLSIVKAVLNKNLSFLHQKRIHLLYKAVTGLINGSICSLYGIANYLPGTTSLKHRIKSTDRLLSNTHLCQNRKNIYKASVQLWAHSLTHPVILVDWSPLTKDQKWHVLRASIALTGRSFTLYEEVHARDYLGNRNIQHKFLDGLKTLLPEHCQPVIIADSGFRTPFFKKVQQMGWNWIGRIRGKDQLAWDEGVWIDNHSLHDKANDKPQYLGWVKWVKSNALQGHLVLYKSKEKGRKARNLDGSTSKKRYSLKHSQREKEPWLLIYSEGLSDYTADKIVTLYAKRMQIEQTFRDTKNEKWGLGLNQSRCKSKQRFELLLLLIHLAVFVLYCVGEYGRQNHLERQFQSRNCTKRREISIITLAKRILKRLKIRITQKDLLKIFNVFQHYANNWLFT